jgi:excisionase family DNA binding protein
VPDDLIEAVAECVIDQLDRDNGPEPWIGVRDAADHLACKPQRIYDLVHRRDSTRIPHRRDGSRLLFRRSDLDAWLDRGGGR